MLRHRGSSPASTEYWIRRTPEGCWFFGTTDSIPLTLVVSADSFWRRVWEGMTLVVRLAVMRHRPVLEGVTLGELGTLHMDPLC